MKVVASGAVFLVLSARAALAATLVGAAGDDNISGSAVQVGDAVQGVNTMPGRTRLRALLAIVAVVVIAAVVALMLWVAPLARSGVGAEDANPKAGIGSAVIHDDAGNVHPGSEAGFAIVHDDAGNVHPETRAGSASAPEKPRAVR